MDQLKRVSAVLGAAFGSLAMLYLVFACSLTRKNFGLSIEDQLIAQRILTLLLLAALPVVIVLIKHVCLRLDLSSFDKMVVNSTMDTKSFSRVEHIERVDLWKKVKMFVVGWFATEMPRCGVCLWGLASWKGKTTVVIYCGNHVGLFILPSTIKSFANNS